MHASSIGGSVATKEDCTVKKVSLQYPHGSPSTFHVKRHPLRFT